jgi:uncharacterized membrane protein
MSGGAPPSQGSMGPTFIVNPDAVKPKCAAKSNVPWMQVITLLTLVIIDIIVLWIKWKPIKTSVGVWLTVVLIIGGIFMLVVAIAGFFQPCVLYQRAPASTFTSSNGGAF